MLSNVWWSGSFYYHNGQGNKVIKLVLSVCLMSVRPSVWGLSVCPSLKCISQFSLRLSLYTIFLYRSDQCWSILIWWMPINTDPINVDRYRSNQWRSIQIQSMLINTDRINADLINADQYRSDKCQSIRIRSMLITTDPINTDLISANQYRSNKCRSDQCWSFQMLINTDRMNADQ